MMRDIYEKLVEEDGASPEDEFSMDVDLELHVEGLGDGEASSVPGKVSLTYRIELDWRSWGIKDINVAPLGEVEFEVEIVDVEDSPVDTIPVNIDFVDVDTALNWVAGHSYVPESLEVSINRSGEITGVELNFYFQSQ